jgi:hypothetical protein
MHATKQYESDRTTSAPKKPKNLDLAWFDRLPYRFVPVAV